MSTTLIHGNTATEGMGANLNPQAGLLYYSLPTPPGYWLPNAFCQVYRQACPTNDPGDKCKDSREACALRSGNHANSYQPTVDGHQCQKPLFNQPCDWNVSACEEETDACLLGKSVYFVPYAPIDGTFPNPCGAGYVGSNESEFQVSATCAGKCSAGTFCPDSPTVQPLPCPGGHYCEEGSSVPRACPGGTYSNATNLENEWQCTNVNPGYFAVAGSKEQTACPRGMFTNASMATKDRCEACAADQYQDETGASSCISCASLDACPIGQYRAGCGSSSSGSCTPCIKAHDEYFTLGAPPQISDACPKAKCSNLTCTPGTIRTGSCGVDATRSNNEYECTACSPGTMAPNVGSVECTPCPAGMYQESSGEARCNECTRGLYCPEGTSNPLSCEGGGGIPNAVTSIAGASSRADCVCKPGYFDDGSSVDLPVHCVECPSGSDCSKSPGATTARIPIRRGYYRRDNISLDVRRCPDASSNCTDSPECEESTSGCRGTLALEDDAGVVETNLTAGRRLAEVVLAANLTQCHVGLTGLFCLLCEPRADGTRVYYVGASSTRRAECKECRESARDTILIAIGVLIALAAVACLVFTGYHTFLSEARKKQLKRAWCVFKPHNKLKILLGAPGGRMPCRLPASNSHPS